MCLAQTLFRNLLGNYDNPLINLWADRFIVLIIKFDLRQSFLKVIEKLDAESYRAEQSPQKLQDLFSDIIQSEALKSLSKNSLAGWFCVWIHQDWVDAPGPGDDLKIMWLQIFVYIIAYFAGYTTFLRLF